MPKAAASIFRGKNCPPTDIRDWRTGKNLDWQKQEQWGPGVCDDGDVVLSRKCNIRSSWWWWNWWWWKRKWYLEGGNCKLLWCWQEPSVHIILSLQGACLSKWSSNFCGRLFSYKQPSPLNSVCWPTCTSDAATTTCMLAQSWTLSSWGQHYTALQCVHGTIVVKRSTSVHLTVLLDWLTAISMATAASRMETL